MKNFILIFLLGPCYLVGARAQNNFKEKFEAFAERLDSLMIDAYYKQDVKLYEEYLNDFQKEYNGLTKSEKDDFSGYYSSALYNLCCTYSLLGNKKEALKYFQKSIEAGYADYMHLQQDTDLDNIRNDAEFKRLIATLRETGDYLYILRKASLYDRNDSREVPKFTYQDPENSHLTMLRKELHLDSIAGSGNEVSKILNLMHWIHYLIPHDGIHSNPEVMNAMNMIDVCRSDKRGLNCRGLAIVLNECYLSMGMKSRIITCLPKDSLGVDPDCHVINMVYSNTLKKWLWMDPTFDAYVMNEKGELLGVEEVRERIINDQPLILNPDANWNRQTTQSKEYYLFTYMAKNLYRLQCPVNSQYDSETKDSGKTIEYIELLPLDYFVQKPDVYSEIDTEKNTTYRFYKTNNSFLFWKEPIE